jgi:hypothetical protein
MANSEGRSVAEWIDWAERRADALEAVSRKPDALFGDVGTIRAWTYRD